MLIEAAQKWATATDFNRKQNEKADKDLLALLVNRNMALPQTIVIDKRYGLDVVRVVLEDGVSINIPLEKENETRKPKSRRR